MGLFVPLAALALGGAVGWALALRLIYRYASTGGPAATLSSGGQLSAHADFFNAWRPAVLNRLVQTCLNALRHCQRGN